MSVTKQLQKWTDKSFMKNRAKSLRALELYENGCLLGDPKTKFRTVYVPKCSSSTVHTSNNIRSFTNSVVSFRHLFF